MERGTPLRSRIGRVAGVALAAQLVAASAWASEGGEGGAGGDPWMALLWKTVNFLVLMGLIWYYARKPLAGMLRGAAKAEQSALNDPRQRAQRAETELAEQRTRIEQLETELQRLLAASREEAEHEHERILRETREQGQRIRSAVSQQVALEFNKAHKELQSELAAQTVKVAESLIRKRLDAAEQARVVGRAIERLGANQ